MEQYFSVQFFLTLEVSSPLFIEFDKAASDN